MKDKTKGLLLGLTIGTMLSGTVAYAGGTQIDVAFRQLKYMFDGVEKKPTEGSGFIYEGVTYVPLRFVSEALGKKVEWDDAASTIWVGDRMSSDAAVAVYQGGQVTKSEYDTFLNVQKLLNPSYAQYEKNDNYKTFMIKELIKEKWFTAQATDAQKADAAAKADEQLAAWKKASGGEEAFRNQLAGAKLVESDLKQYVLQSSLATTALQARVTDAMLQARYDEALKADPGAFTVASVRHILIGLNDETGKAIRTKDEALKRAQEVEAKLKAGGDFAELAKTYSDDPGSKNNGGLYANTAVSGWVDEFKKASLELPIGELSEPVLSTFGYHVMKVESRKQMTLEEAKPELQAAAADEAQQKFMSEELPGIVQSIQLPK